MLIGVETQAVYINVFPNSVGSYGYDAWGFNIRNMKNNMRLIKYLYEDYFQAEAFGLENKKSLLKKIFKFKENLEKKIFIYKIVKNFMNVIFLFQKDVYINLICFFSFFKNLLNTQQ